MKNKEFSSFSIFFVFVALWNLIGAIFGYFNTALTFQLFFSRELTDPLIYTIYKGAWGTSLVYFIGYLIVAFKPARHTGIVIVGGIGKMGFAIKLLQLYLLGIANPIVFVVIIGDFICSLFFIYYLGQIYKVKKSII